MQNTISSTHSGFNHIVAFEVSKAELVVNILPGDRLLTIANHRKAIRRLLTSEAKRNAKHGLGRMLAVCEATGGYEREIIAVASDLGVDCHRAHGSSVRAYAKFSGTHAKSDPIDVRMIARFAQTRQDLRLYLPPRAEQTEIRELMGRRDELNAMIGAERCRLEHQTLKIVVKSIAAHIKALEKQLGLIDDEIERLIAHDQDFAHKARLMRSLKGVGPVTAAAVLAYLPEIGQVSKATIAALAGVAPFDRDSGKTKGARHIFAGRGVLRTKLYMAAVAAITHNPVLRDYAQGLSKRGKPSRVVITAVMRKIITILNAIIATQTPWKHANSA